jgi:hypothetical protein
MAKKTKRLHRKAAVTQVTPVPAEQTKGEASTTAPRTTMVGRTAAATKVDLAQEYHYVFADLRKIAIIAVVMFALLFALAFVLK